jgi:bleomycin hydrolase
MSFDYTPRDFYYRFLSSVRYIPVVCDARYPPGTRIVSNDANMFGGLPSLYLNVTIDDIEEYAIASLKRNIPVWFACDVKKQLTPEGGRMCSHTDRLSELLPVPHKRGTKLQEIRHFNAIANHALIISAVSMKAGKPVAWRIVNSWGDIGRNAGVFVACGDWFREHVYSINVVYDTLSRQHKADIDLRLVRPTVRLGPFDPSVI